ncbi:MAG: hypothetical protein LW832_02960, partial [Parachlamydia sp.]|nr:hypothetical protein [Parachlamydia sp.]
LQIHSKVNLAIQFSKWLSVSLLVDDQEMADLLRVLPPFFIFPTSGVLEKGAGAILKEDFLSSYEAYVQALKNGKILQDSTIFSSVFTTTVDAMYEVHLSSEKKVIKPLLPVVQLQKFRFNYSTTDGRFHPMTHGPGTINWGVQFSYPTLFQDEHLTVTKVRRQDNFPNSDLFKTCQKWVRDHTVPVPFYSMEKVVNVPFRLGKKCFGWINDHPQLKEHGLKVKCNE